MNKYMLFLVAFLLLPIAEAGRCVDDADSQCWNRSLLLYLDLNESKGNRLDEVISHTFTSQGTVNSKSAVFGNGSLHDDSTGQQQYLNATAYQDIKTFDNFTACMLVNFTSIDGFQNVLWSRTCYTGSPNCPASQRAWRLAEHNTGQLLFSVWNGISANFACEISSTSMSVKTNGWNLICGRKNATALALFINGTQVGQSGCSANANNQTDIAISLGQDSSYASAGVEDNYKPDFIADSAFIWNGSLPVEMMQKLATNTEHGFTSLGDVFYVGEAVTEEALTAGIQTSTIWPATVDTNQQVYLTDLNNNQVTGTFDRLASQGSQRWLLDYLTASESRINGLFNITPSIYAAEYQGLAFQQVNDSVRQLINSTDT